MSSSDRKPIFLKDYTRPPYFIPSIQLVFNLDPEKTKVKTTLELKRNTEGPSSHALSLNGENLKLLSIKMDGRDLGPQEFEVTDTHLTIKTPPEEFTLEIETEISPSKNKSLEGLYFDAGIFCTQNESQGFRKITYFLDRPDIMSRFEATLIADKSKYPVLLANGEQKKAGGLEGGKHYATWEDPFLKPCYLFALVAGNLGVIKDTFITRSKRTIDLHLYVDPGKESQAAYAMDCLKEAMRWDEDTFGLECDLKTYMIVAVDAFNFGAMENKGLNIFNAQYILATPEIATDTNYENILSVIGHEYFHNWTGNRVTCRDWFQITLKEGLTIFRDEEFAADMASRPVKRIRDIRYLREYQFPEDAGPNAHPIHPEAYLEVNNFYTATVYHKGSEVIRMIHTLIGAECFKAGMKKYFELFDGKAVTTEDFVRSMELASGQDLTQFKQWYSQVGTPILRVTSRYATNGKKYTLVTEQIAPKIRSTKAVEQKRFEPLHLPLTVALLDKKGKEIPLTSKVLPISKRKQEFVFTNVPSNPVPSLLRNFSAPVLLDYDYSFDELLFLFHHDTDLFNRYEAGQRIARSCIEKLVSDVQNRESLLADQKIMEAFSDLLEASDLDLAFKAEVLMLPSLSSLVEGMPRCDIEGTYQAREFFLTEMAKHLENTFLRLYQQNHATGPFQMDAHSIAKRSIKNMCLSYLSLVPSKYEKLLWEQFDAAHNMTDEIAALGLLCNQESKYREQAIDKFYKKWKSNKLVMNKWFAVQASSKRDDTLQKVQKLTEDSAYDKTNANKIRSLLGVFAHNLPRFHNLNGEGYDFLAEQISQTDPLNPQVASNLAKSFHLYSRLDTKRKQAMQKALETILATPKLSNDTYEIVSKTLGAS